MTNCQHPSPQLNVLPRADIVTFCANLNQLLQGMLSVVHEEVVVQGMVLVYINLSLISENLNIITAQYMNNTG
jgi:hypothetical protein